MKSLIKAAFFTLALTTGGACAGQVLAGPAQEALSACLAAKTTAADHVILADWVFSVISLHPSVASMSSITEAQRDDLNKKTGALYTRLLATDCGTELKAAVEKEGTDSVGAAFSSLGETAMQDLMSDPKVQAGSNAVTAYIDEAKIGAALADKPATAGN